VWATLGWRVPGRCGRCVSTFLDKNSRHIAKSQSKRPPPKTKRNGRRTVLPQLLPPQHLVASLQLRLRHRPSLCLQRRELVLRGEAIARAGALQPCMPRRVPPRA
jgi:hypothetical protein